MKYLEDTRTLYQLSYQGSPQKIPKDAKSSRGWARGKGPACQCRLSIRDSGSIPGSEKSPGGGHSNPLQYSCLENPTDRGAWQAAVHGVIQSQTWLKCLSMHAKVIINLICLALSIYTQCSGLSFCTELAQADSTTGCIKKRSSNIQDLSHNPLPMQMEELTDFCL